MADRLTRCRPLLGTFVEITGGREDAIDAAFETIERVHTLMSAHEPGSDISRINCLAHGQEVEVHPWTAAVLERALHWWTQSKGVFDVLAAGAAALSRGNLPRHNNQPRPLAQSSADLEVADCSVRLYRPACVDVGGIAKGFAVDRAVEAMRAAGATSGMVNAGGDIAAFGPDPWPVQVVGPHGRRAIANVAVANGAIATSSLLPGGRADHLPGRASDIVAVSVCAPSAIDADALTKIVLSSADCTPQCLELATAQALVVTADGSVHGVRVQQQAA